MLLRVAATAVLFAGTSGVATGQSAGDAYFGPLVLPPPEVGSLTAELTAPLSESLPLPDETETLTTPTAEIEVPKITPTPMWYQPAYWFGETPWDMSVEFGLNGSEGNNDVLSLRAGGHVKRKTKDWKFNTGLQYNKNHTNGVETQNNGKMDLRLDRILDDSPWSLFFQENLIYDEFQAFDIQLSLNTGVGYQLIETDSLNLAGRFGAGATREIGGVDNAWMPQALIGAEYEHQLTKLQKLVAKVDYFPEWADYRDYRVVTDVGWQIDLDRPDNLSLKFSLVDRYDSTPDGVKPNNFDYAVLLMWSL